MDIHHIDEPCAVAHTHRMTNASLLKRTFGERLTKARHVANLDQAHMAIALGISRRSIVSYESDERIPRMDIVQRWAEITDVPIMWLLEDDQGIVTTDTVTPGYLWLPWYADMHDPPCSN